MEKVFHFLEGPGHVLSASTVCRRWHELACAGSVWRVKVEREGILDKAKAFEVEVPPLLLLEGASLEDEAAASLAFYARVFALKVVRGSAAPLVRCFTRAPHRRLSYPPPLPPPPSLCRDAR